MQNLHILLMTGKHIIQHFIILTQSYGQAAHTDDNGDWAKRIDLILEVGGDNVLDNGGHITAEFAKHFAEAEFEKYRIIQDKNFSSDFDKLTGNTFLLPEIPSDIPSRD